MTSETSTTSLEAPRTIDAFASIRFAGDSLQPATVSALMGVEPSLSYAKGDTFVAGTRRTRQTRRFGLWLLSSEGVVDSAALPDHEAFVASVLRKAGEGLADLLSEEAVTLTVALFWYGDTEGALPTAGKDLATLVERLGGVLEVDVERDTANERVA